jgi:tripartite motif-containing protein 71
VRNQNLRTIHAAARRVLPWFVAFAMVSGVPAFTGVARAVATSADLALTKSDGVGSVSAGGSTTYSLTLHNGGTAVVPAGVVISDPIPSGTVGSESEPACAIATGTLTCTTPTRIPVGGSVSYAVTLKVGPSFGGAKLRNTASIDSSPVADPVAANDTDVDVDAVVPAGAVTYTGQLAGPGLADMYPVDVVDSGSFYYVVDPGRYRVLKIDRGTGQIVASSGGHQSRAKGQFGAARALSADAAGNIYVADTPNNRIQVLSPNLDFLRSWGTGGTGPGQFNMVYGVTVGIGTGAGGARDEVVYTTDGGRVQKFTRTGTYLSQFGQGALNQPRQLAVSPLSHDVYVVSARDRQVVVFDQAGTERFRFGGGGTGNGQFMGDIRGIDIDDAGRVYVSDDGNHRVQVFDAAGTYLYQFGNTGTGDQHLTDARGLTVTHDGLVCVSDEWDFGLKEYRINSQGTGASFARFMFGGSAPLPGLNSPRGIAVNESTGSIYAVDWWNQRVERFDASGTFRSAWGRRGTTAEPGSINFAWDAAVDPNSGNVFVANRESHEIEVFDASGSYLTRWGTRGTAPGMFTFPQGVAFDPTDGTLLVTDAGNGSIERFSVTAGGQGTFVTSYGSKGTAAGQFATPTGIDVADDGTIWIADTQNDRVERRDPSTGTWTAYAVAQGDTVGFKSPWGVTVAPNGQIWVADTGRDRLVRMGSGGVFASAVDPTSLGIGSMDAPFDVAFGVDGTIYVSAVWDNRILELSQT